MCETLSKGYISKFNYAFISTKIQHIKVILLPIAPFLNFPSWVNKFFNQEIRFDRISRELEHWLNQ